MDKSEVLEHVNRFSKLVIEKYHPLKIVLYGSYARGTAHKNSDIDVAVIFERIEEEKYEDSASFPDAPVAPQKSPLEEMGVGDN